MDWEFACVCPQYNTYSLCCKWFRSAVLPANAELEASILNRSARKKCTICGKAIHVTSNRMKYCPTCSKKVRRQKEAIRLHNYYLKSRI